MKTFPIRLTDELHREIRLKAFDAHKSIHQYILDCIFGEPEEEWDGTAHENWAKPMKEMNRMDDWICKGCSHTFNLSLQTMVIIDKNFYCSGCKPKEPKECKENSKTFTKVKSNVKKPKCECYGAPSVHVKGCNK